MKRIELLLGAIGAEDDEQAEAAALALLPEDEPGLLKLLYSNSDAEYRWWLVRALAQCGGEQAAAALAATLHDPEASVRGVALMALASVYTRAPSAVRPFLGLMAARLADDDGLVRQAATDALAKCGDDAVETLERVLQDGPDAARTRATAALRKIATMRAAAVLYRYLNDPNYLVRMYAYEALDEMGLLDTLLFKP